MILTYAASDPRTLSPPASHNKGRYLPMVVENPASNAPNTILVVGDDPTILASRAVQLAQWNPLTSTSDGAVSVLEKGTFGLVVIGESVPEQRTIELIATLQGLQPSPKLLLIRNPESATDFGVATYVVRLYLHPGWLLEKVREMLVTSAKAKPLQSIH